MDEELYSSRPRRSPPPCPGNYSRFDELTVNSSQKEISPSYEGPFSVDFVVEQLGNSPSDYESKEEVSTRHQL